MSKISQLPEVAAPDGTETVVILKDGVAKRAGLGAVLDPLVSSATEAAEGFAAAAAASAAAADLPTERARRLKQKVLAAVPRIGNAYIACLLTKDGAKTYMPGTTKGEIETIQSLIGDITFGQQAVTWNGTGGADPDPALRPTEGVTGLRFGSQTGFVARDSEGNFTGIIPDTGEPWCLDYVLRFAPPAAEYASVAAMNADAASLAVGAFAKVVDGPVTTQELPWEDIPPEAIGPVELQPNQLVQGYYVKGNGAMDAVGAGKPLLSMWDSTGSGSVRMAFLFADPRGQLFWYGYDGTVQTFGNTWAQDTFADGSEEAVHIKLFQDADGLVLIVNGVEVTVSTAVTDFAPDRFQLNGLGTPLAGYDASPVNGIAYELDALCVGVGLDFIQSRNLSDVIADACGTPAALWDRIAHIIVVDDQSRFSGTDDPSPTPNKPDPISNWNFRVSPETNTDSRTWFPSQERLPFNVFAPRNLNDPVPGPLRCVPNIYGNPTGGSHTMSGSGKETIEWGFMRELLAQAPASVRNRSFYFPGCTFGGYAQAWIEAEDAGVNLFELCDPASTVTQPRSLEYRAIQRCAQHANKRGSILVPLFIPNFQGETLSYNTPDNLMIGEIHKADLIERQKRIGLLCSAGVMTPPILGKKAISYSFDGDSNSFMTDSAYRTDAQFQALEAENDDEFRFLFFGFTYAIGGRGIHWPHILQRDMGAMIGHRVGKAYFRGKIGRSLHIRAAEISGSNLLLHIADGKRVELVESNGPMVTGWYSSDGIGGGGVKTYGLVFVPDAASPGRTIAGDVTVINGGAAIQVPISGAGPLAGDRIDVTGLGAMFTNFREINDAIAYYPTQNWPALPFAPGSENPVLDYSAPLPLADWLAPHAVTVGA